jgi:hypothetical protein
MAGAPCMLFYAAGRGMRKSLAALSLLIHNHCRATKLGIFFGVFFFIIETEINTTII